LQLDIDDKSFPSCCWVRETMVFAGLSVCVRVCVCLSSCKHSNKNHSRKRNSSLINTFSRFYLPHKVALFKNSDQTENVWIMMNMFSEYCLSLLLLLLSSSRVQFGIHLGKVSDVLVCRVQWLIKLRRLRSINVPYVFVLIWQARESHEREKESGRKVIWRGKFSRIYDKRSDIDYEAYVRKQWNVRTFFMSLFIHIVMFLL
jgi:hypothetical protein